MWSKALFLPSVLATVLAFTAIPPEEAHWRHHDGHWSYWHPEDHRWYYTNGEHWFFEHDGRWEPYRFDGKFGREHFERGEYKVPGPKVKIEVPRHRVYHQ
jgi:hypothetical protein